MTKTSPRQRRRTSSVPDDGQGVGRLVALLRHRYRFALARAALPYSLTAPQVSVLLALAESDGAAPTAIATRAHMDPPMVTRLLDRLETAGLLVRERDGRDRRRVRVHLSRRGRALVPHLQPLEGNVEARLISGFSEEEQTALRHFLERLCQNLDARRLDRKALDGKR
jgi:DNA-binding MarR family transcriptional regulator